MARGRRRWGFKLPEAEWTGLGFARAAPWVSPGVFQGIDEALSAIKIIQHGSTPSLNPEL